MFEKTVSKHTSRIAAVQVMYQKDISPPDTDISKIINNFIIYYIQKEDSYKNISLSFFKKLTAHFSDDIDFEEIINSSLTNTTISSSNSLMKSILKVAIIELLFESTDIPVIINEFVEISKYFIDEKSVKFINSLLDRISKKVERKCLKEV